MGWVGGGAPKAPDPRPQAEAMRYSADLQYKAHQESIAEWKKYREQTRKDFKPWRDVGLKALDRLDKGVDEGLFDIDPWEGFRAGDMQMDPGYAFRVQEGMKAINRKFASGSGANSGATMKALQNYGQNLASAEFGAARGRALQDYHLRNAPRRQEFSDLLTVSGIGQNATAQNVGFQTGAMQNIAQHNVSGARALGQGEVGAQQAIYNAQLQNQQMAWQHEQAQFGNFLALAGLTAGIGFGVGGLGLKMGWWGPGASSGAGMNWWEPGVA